jgi:hypothetical protein
VVPKILRFGSGLMPRKPDVRGPPCINHTKTGSEWYDATVFRFTVPSLIEMDPIVLASLFAE